MVGKLNDNPTDSSCATQKPQVHRSHEKLLRRLFLVGLGLKCVDGATETITGIILFVVSKAQISRLILWMLGNELYEYPADFFTKVALKADQHFWYASKLFAAIFLVGHGLVKVFLVVNLLRNRLWAYPTAIIVLLGFVGYQIFRLCNHFSITLIVLTASDLLVILLIFLEYRRKRRSTD